MSKVLLVLSHPNYKESFANKTIVEKIKTLIPDIEIDHIDELYPDEKIDIKAEQEKLLRNDTVIFQFPMYWHNRPHFLSRWFEEVYQYGFAYGNNGFKLKDKRIIVSMTLGNTEKFFQGEISLDKLVSPFKASAAYTMQKFLGFVFTDKIVRNIRELQDEMKEKTKMLEKHAEKLVEMSKK